MSLEDHNGLSKVPHICHTVVEHWCGLVKHKDLTNLSTIKPHNSHCEPKIHEAALLNPAWEDDMDQKILALERNRTWTIVPLPQGKKTIG